MNYQANSKKRGGGGGAGGMVQQAFSDVRFEGANNPRTEKMPIPTQHLQPNFQPMATLRSVYNSNIYNYSIGNPTKAGGNANLPPPKPTKVKVS